MSDPRDHHYLPQFHLSGWCRPSGMLTVYSRPRHDVVISQLSPKGTAYERDLYAYRLVPEGQRQAIEARLMKPLDDTAAPILRKLLAGGLSNLTGLERAEFTRYVLSLRARHPDAIALAHRQGRSDLLAKLDERPEEYLALRGASEAPTFSAWVEQNAPHVLANFGLSVVPKVILNERMVKRLWDMPWWTYDLRKASTDLLIRGSPMLADRRRDQRPLRDRATTQPEDAAYRIKRSGGGTGDRRNGANGTSEASERCYCH